MEEWQTGGEEYFIIYENGTHELVKATNNDDVYEVVFHGHWEKCKLKMNEIIANNVDYDYNL